MANEEQLAILRQGVDVWNKWADKHIENVYIDLTDVDLSNAQLLRALLSSAHLTRSNLSKAFLYGANFANASLRQANLSGADLRQTNFTQAYLGGTYLVGANLISANLNGTFLGKSNFSGVLVGTTIFGDLDLREIEGLDAVVHTSPSLVSTGTFALSKGKISSVFLRGCGLRDWEIEAVKLYNPDLSNDERNKILSRIYDLQATQAVQISPLFISYSNQDISFVEKLEVQLNKRGIRSWRDVRDAVAGRLETQIDRAIRQNPTVLLVLSSNALSSDWVEHEVRTARGLEKEIGRDVLCPVALDDSWKSSCWPKRIMEQIMEYNILDFSEWEDESKFEGMFRKLIDGLELFYKE